MDYWKSKVLPKIKKVFEKNPKKAAAAEACKTFDGSKEEINKEFEGKKELLQPKVIEIYEKTSVEVKTVVKERKESGLKKHSAAVNTFLEELVKIDFPGSKPVSEASSQFGPALVSSSVFFVFEKVAAFIPAEAPKAEEAAAKEAPKEVEVEAAVTEKEIVVEEEKKDEPKKEEEVAAPAEEVKAEAVAASTEAPATVVAVAAPAEVVDVVEEKKKEEAPKA